MVLLIQEVYTQTLSSILKALFYVALERTDWAISLQPRLFNYPMEQSNQRDLFRAYQAIRESVISLLQLQYGYITIKSLEPTSEQLLISPALLVATPVKEH